MVRNYQKADCSLRQKIIVSLITIFVTLSFSLSQTSCRIGATWRIGWNATAMRSIATRTYVTTCYYQMPRDSIVMGHWRQSATAGFRRSFGLHLFQLQPLQWVDTGRELGEEKHRDLWGIRRRIAAVHSADVFIDDTASSRFLRVRTDRSQCSAVISDATHVLDSTLGRRQNYAR